MRTGGAVMLASIGMELTRIEMMARWRSPMIFGYAQTAPVLSKCGKLDSQSTCPTLVARSIQKLEEGLLRVLLDGVEVLSQRNSNYSVNSYYVFGPS